MKAGNKTESELHTISVHVQIFFFYINQTYTCFKSQLILNCKCCLGCVGVLMHDPCDYCKVTHETMKRIKKQNISIKTDVLT